MLQIHTIDRSPGLRLAGKQRPPTPRRAWPRRWPPAAHLGRSSWSTKRRASSTCSNQQMPVNSYLWTRALRSTTPYQNAHRGHMQISDRPPGSPAFAPKKAKDVGRSNEGREMVGKHTGIQWRRETKRGWAKGKDWSGARKRKTQCKRDVPAAKRRRRRRNSQIQPSEVRQYSTRWTWRGQPCAPCGMSTCHLTHGPGICWDSGG